jgi:hypothetical protein
MMRRAAWIHGSLTSESIAPEMHGQRRTALGALAILLCLACSWGSDLIIANTSSRALTIRGQFEYDLVRGSILPIEFADVTTIGHGNAWHAAPESDVTVDTVHRSVHLTLPPGTAARLGSASNCHRPETCHSFPMLWLELSGNQGSIHLDGAQLQAAFVRDTDYQWVLWYPLIGTHDLWKNLRLARAAMLCVALGVAAFALWAAFLVARTPMPRRWGWSVVALLGVGKVVVNWTTGETIMHLAWFPSISAPIGHGERLGPWLVALWFPLGALLALWRRQRILGRLPSSE